ncbi:MAG TPA: nucleotide-binding protein [Casimicrobiaceae bacterium]|nr:nucleotide-binding protein [Casimicrobiaceae bacterium]
MSKLLVVLLAAFAAHAGAAVTVGGAQVNTLTGQVLEAIDAGSYTYLRLKTGKGETWAAVERSTVKKGVEVTIFDPAEMANFESKALNRTFPTIVFGTIGTQPSPAASVAKGGHGSADVGAMHGSVGKSIDVPVAKVAKAEGADARTVAEVNSQRLALKDKPVTLRAQVVKVTPEVMGKTWVHLRDGSGSAADGSNDVLATGKDVPKVGDVVLAKGVVRTDVNLGSGYVYKVLVEDVSFRK